MVQRIATTLNQLPNNVEDEIVALGIAVLRGHEMAQPFIELFTVEDFHDHWHRQCFEAIKGLVEEGAAVNPHSVWHRLSVMPGISGQATKLREVVNLQHGLSGKADLPHLMEVLGRLRPLSVRRRLYRFCNKIAIQAGMSDTGPSYDQAEDTPPPDPQMLLAMVEDECSYLEGLLNVHNIKRGPESLGEIAPRIKTTLERYHRREQTGVQTGITELDGLLDGDGLQPQGMYIVSGPPKQGKTSLALSIGYHVAKHQQKTVAIFELEMHREVLTRRLFAMETGIPFFMMRKGFYGQPYDLAMTEIDNFDLPILIDDSCHHLGQLARIARSLVFGPRRAELIIVDYLQLLGLSSKPVPLNQRTAEVTAVTRGIKHLAQELNVPFLVISNMNRDQQREDRRPEMIDLRESGQIEFDAEAIIFLWNHLRKKGQEFVPAKIQDLTLIVSAQRNGPTGDIPVKFLRENMLIMSAGDIERANTEAEGAEF